MTTHEVVTVGENRHRELTVTDGDALRNVVVDCNAEGASVSIDAHGTGWEIRHLALVGYNNTTEPFLSVSDRSTGRSVIDNVWLRQGGDGPGLVVDGRHSGTLDVSRVVIEEFTGGYDSSPPVAGAGGTTSYTDCYAAGCYSAGFITGTDHLERCIAAPGDTTAATGRGVWARGNTELERCDISAGGEHYAIHAGIAGRGVTVNVVDSTYDDSFDNGGLFEEASSTIVTTNTSHDPITSVRPPMPATEAAAYEGDDDATPPPAHDVADRDFELVTPQYDEHITRILGGGEELTNTVFDLHHSRTAATIHADGPDWRIANVAFEGEIDHPGASPAIAIVAAVPAGREAVIENVWLGDGSPLLEPNTTGQIAIYVRNDHAGTLRIRNSTFKYWPGGCITASSDTPGEVIVEDCHLGEFGYEGVALPGDGSAADNCVFVNTTGDYS